MKKNRRPSGFISYGAPPCVIAVGARCGVKGGTNGAVSVVTAGALRGATCAALFEDTDDVVGSFDVSGNEVFCSVGTGGGCLGGLARPHIRCFARLF